MHWVGADTQTPSKPLSSAISGLPVSANGDAALAMAEHERLWIRYSGSLLKSAYLTLLPVQSRR